MLLSKRGSSTVEAAMIFPLVVLITAGIIRHTLGFHDRIRNASAEHLEKTESFMENRLLTTEDVLRVKWKAE